VREAGPNLAPTLAPPDRRVLGEEVLIVLSLSLLAAAVDALLSLVRAPVNPSVAVSLFRDVELAAQVADIVFDFAPVALVVHLARRSREGLGPFGLSTATLGQDARWGVAGGAGVAAVGLGLYLGAIALEVNRFVVPVPPLGHWWTIPILVLGASQNAVLEEVVVVGYLIRRLEQMGWSGGAAVAASATLRGAYHLYQGWGGFVSNLALGIAFGYAFLRWRRTWPLVIAHALVDVLAGVGYILARGRCFIDVCVP
jgi:membrane protease YdiL (CAAX protease family)